MTYNFDADGWHEIQLRLLEHRLETGDIDATQYRQELEELDRRHEAMLERLDGTYSMPEETR